MKSNVMIRAFRPSAVGTGTEKLPRISTGEERRLAKSIGLRVEQVRAILNEMRGAK